MDYPTVLLTGATGFIGGATLSAWLQSGAMGRMLILARGESADGAAARVRQSVQRFIDLASVDRELRQCWLII